MQNAPQAVLDLLRCKFFFNLGLSVYFFLFNLLLTARGYTEAQLGLLTSALAAGSLTGAVPAGWLIQRAGLRRALLACIGVAPALLCARALAPAFPAKIVLSVLAGMALSLWAVCVSPAVAGTTGERQRPLAFSLLFSFGIGTGAIGALAGSRLPQFMSRLPMHSMALPPFQMTLLASCCFASLGLWPAARLRSLQTGVSTDPAVIRQLRTILLPCLKRFLPAVAIWGLVTGSFAPFANVYLSAHLHLHLSRTGQFFSASQLLQVAAVLFAPFVFRRFGLVKGIALAQFGTALCFLLLAVTDHSSVAAYLFVLLSGVQWMNEPGLYTLLMDLVPEHHRGSASASMAFVLSTAQLVAASAAGWGFAHAGYIPVFVIIAGLAMLAAAAVRTVPGGRRPLQTMVSPSETAQAVLPRQEYQT